MEKYYGGVYLRKGMVSVSLSLLAEIWTKLKLTLWICKCCQHNLWLCSTSLYSSLCSFHFCKAEMKEQFQNEESIHHLQNEVAFKRCWFLHMYHPALSKKTLLKIPLPYITCCISSSPCCSSCPIPVMLMVLVGWARVKESCLTLTLQLKAAHPASPECNALTVLVLVSTSWRTCTDLKD